jgi:hypothetical protein
MFNTEGVCMECKALEELRPDYKNAIATDEQAIRTGRLQFPRNGLAKNET